MTTCDHCGRAAPTSRVEDELVDRETGYRDALHLCDNCRYVATVKARW